MESKQRKLAVFRGAGTSDFHSCFFSKIYIFNPFSSDFLGICWERLFRFDSWQLCGFSGGCWVRREFTVWRKRMRVYGWQRRCGMKKSRNYFVMTGNERNDREIVREREKGNSIELGSNQVPFWPYFNFDKYFYLVVLSRPEPSSTVGSFSVRERVRVRALESRFWNLLLNFCFYPIPISLLLNLRIHITIHIKCVLFSLGKFYMKGYFLLFLLLTLHLRVNVKSCGGGWGRGEEVLFWVRSRTIATISIVVEDTCIFPSFPSLHFCSR